MYRTKIVLKQETPLIHFEYQEAKHGLRASEVKPTFDRWLHTLGVQLNEEWYIDKSKHNALDYKLKITCNNPREYKIATQRKKEYVLGNYFGASSGFVYEQVELEFLSYFPELIDLIKLHIQGFFLCNNFGNRKTKGFGGFTVSNIDGEVIKFKIEHLLNAIKLSKEYFLCWVAKNPLQHKRTIENFFELTLSQYKVLKSGDAFTRRPSSMMMHFLEADPPVFWEKAFIYLTFAKAGVLQQVKERYDLNIEGADELDYAFVRMLLGMPNQYEYRLLHQPGKVNVSVEDANGFIERFPSPITFKLIEKNVYVLVRKIHNRVFSNKFNFKISHSNSIDFKSIKFEEIFSPDPNEFKLREFLNNNISEHYSLIYPQV